MPGMISMSLECAKRTANSSDLIELKIDGTRIRYTGDSIISDRDVNRNTRYHHVLEELKQMPWKVRGEMAIPGGNILQLNKKENWHKAKYHIFDIYEYEGQNVSHLKPSESRKLITHILSNADFKHITTPKKFDSFQEGWDFVTTNDAEGLVLKSIQGYCSKVKYLKEAKLPIICHESGKSKGAFWVMAGNVKSKVSATSMAFVEAYNLLEKKGIQAYAEIEYAFLTANGTPFQPRLRRVGTLDDLSTT